jgi:hypothetical protein
MAGRVEGRHVSLSSLVVARRQIEDQRVPFTLFHDELVRIILSAPAAER